jgi:hypothetical protein
MHMVLLLFDFGGCSMDALSKAFYLEEASQGDIKFIKNYCWRTY